MESLGFKSLESNVCLFRHKELGILVVLYINDLLIAAPHVDLVNCIRNSLRYLFDLKELGEVKRFLGFDVIRDRQARKVFVS